MRTYPGIYDELLKIAATRGLILAQNDHAVAMAGFGHRYPSLAIWPLHAPAEPWEYSPEQLRGISDLVHAMHAATGAEVPCNEEWYYRPPSSSIPMRMRILIKWRISTIAGFEGGTRIYLNTIDPWSVHQRMLERLVVMRDECSIAQMKLGEECKVTPLLLR